ncbi:hypothetical protein HMPREF0063_11828 [Aeromicrobium marinum DSM 15272]|uniref:Uncharacterized protein n=2 Tax=Aeromicrobium marinum TaxID=219314 RepID=E2SDP2_9ACTN|nr:hypothetical protein HMPREF0063_11828 [Aeromicrobium marinum DSM 15272]
MVAVLPAMSSQAAINNLSAGQTVSGLVPITEARGGQENCNIGDESRSRIEVRRLADNVVVHTANRDGSGALSTTWDSVGQPVGAYRVRSWYNDARRSGFLNLGCSRQGEVLASDISVNLQNRAAVSIDVPTSVVTGEELSFTVRTTIQANGVAATTAAPDRSVVVTIPGVGQQTVQTNGSGDGSGTVDLPDLAAGALTVTATTVDDAIYLSGAGGSDTTTLQRRSTETVYDGATRAQPGDSTTLRGQLVDATPGSDRAGEPVSGEPLTLSLGDDSADVTTSLTGSAQRNLVVSGPSRADIASASYAGGPVYGPSSDRLTFFVGDAVAEPAAESHSLVGGLTRLLGSLLTPPATQVGDQLLAGTGTFLDQLVTGTVNPLLTFLNGTPIEATDLLDVEVLGEQIDLLLANTTGSLNQVGDQADDAVDRLLTDLAANTPFGGLIDTARFRWRSVYEPAEGDDVSAEFDATIGLPQLLDVTGDGIPDVVAAVTLVNGVVDVSTSNLVNPIDVEVLGGNDGTLVPRLEIARLAGAPADLPLSLQALIDLPDASEEYRFGYDTRAADAPEGFRADIVLAGGGAGLQVASRGEDALTVTGALVPVGADGDQPEADPADEAAGLEDEPAIPAGLAPEELRFGVSFDRAPVQARIGLDLASGQLDAQNIAATLQTDAPTTVGLQLVDDSGADEVFLAEGTLSQVDGTVSVAVSGTDETGLTADISSDTPLDLLSVRARTLDAGETVSDVVLGLTDVPTQISFALDAAGAGSLTASGPIGVFEAGFSSGGELALLDDPAYLRLLSEPDYESIAVRLPGFEGMQVDLGESVALSVVIAPTPLRALVEQDDLTIDALIQDAPRELSLALGADGAVEVEGSAPIDSVSIDASSTAEDGILLGAQNLSVQLTDVPSRLGVSVAEDGATFDTGGQAIGLVELSADSGDPLVLTGAEDGLAIDQSGEGARLAARIHGLRTIEASLGEVPELLLDTVAQKIFDVSIVSADPADTITATIDRLQPNLRFGLLDDGSGAMRLIYRADAPTNSLSFSLSGLSGSIAGPLPTALDVCMADDEACLPFVGIDDPALGSIQFAASEYTTLNLVDSTGGLSAQNLRLRRLDLTGSLDTENGGPVYLNTTGYAGACAVVGCEYPIQGGRVLADLGEASLEFTPGNGFSAVNAITNLEPDTLFGQVIGVSGVSGTGIVRCVGATALRVTVNVPILGDITLNLRDAICDVPNRTPGTPPPF